MTVGELRDALALVPIATKCSLGYGCSRGWDSFASLRDIIWSDGKIYLRMGTGIPGKYFPTSISWRHAKSRIEHWAPVIRGRSVITLAEFLESEPDHVEVFLAVQKAFSPRGPHFFVPIVKAGPSVLTSGSETTRYWVDQDEFSIWGEL